MEGTENVTIPEICLSQQSSGPMSYDSMPSSFTGSPELTNHSQVNLPQKKALTETGLRAIEEIPIPFQHIFSAYPSFNAFQSKVIDEILYSDKPVVVSAPTGSGKTVLFELAIVNLLIKMQNLQYNGNFIIVYMAPIKALCTERFRDWQQKFSPLGLVCQEVTGDSEATTFADISTFNIVLTTPEKWDSLTRAWKDNKQTVQMIKLFLLDEIHILNDEQRGPVLEAVISRMKTIQETSAFSGSHKTEADGSSLSLPIRFVAISATVPNIEDVASWLGGIDSPAQYISLGEEYRPVTLRKLVMGYYCAPSFSQFRFELQLSYKIQQLLLQYSEGKPSLIFCSTRKGVTQTADVLIKQLTFHFNTEQKKKLSIFLEKIKENEVKKYVAAGVGCHHAGMTLNDRRIMEDLFRSGGLPVLITTSTLAMGVNLPAHLVIIKSTQQYAGVSYREYSSNHILQMIGRAGRPQYDTHATAIIMTQENNTTKYEKLVRGTDILESNLHCHLAEHLNSEVVLSTITKKTVAINWIRSTFLYVRALRNPTNYGISANLSKKGIEDKLQEMCVDEMNALASAGLMKTSECNVWPTQTGKLMAYHYISFETMKIFTKIGGKEKISEILNIIANCHEFADCKLRVNEKRALNFLNKSIRFPIKSLIKTSQMKVNCLLQAIFGGLVVQEPSLQQESIQIVRTGVRVTKCLARYLALDTKYQSLLSATILCKCFQSNLWEDSLYVSRQLAGIGAVLSQLLVSSGKTSFKLIAESNPRDLERIINRAPPMGNRLQDAALHMPQYKLTVTEVAVHTLIQVNISVELSNYEYIKCFSTPGFDHNLVIIAGDSNNKLLLHQKFQDMLLINNGGSYTWLIEVIDRSLEICIHLISENWVGMDTKTSIIPKRSLISGAAIGKPISDLNQSKICTPNLPVHTNEKVKKNKGKENINKQNGLPFHQLHKSSMNRLSRKKKLPLHTGKKGLQYTLNKYLFKPQEKLKLIPVSKNAPKITNSTDMPQITSAHSEQSYIHETNFNFRESIQQQNSSSLRFSEKNYISEREKIQNKNVTSEPSNCHENQSQSLHSTEDTISKLNTIDNTVFPNCNTANQTEKITNGKFPNNCEEESSFSSPLSLQSDLKTAIHNHSAELTMKSKPEENSKLILQINKDKNHANLRFSNEPATQIYSTPSPMTQELNLKNDNTSVVINKEFHMQLKEERITKTDTTDELPTHSHNAHVTTNLSKNFPSGTPKHWAIVSHATSDCVTVAINSNKNTHRYQKEASYKNETELNKTSQVPKLGNFDLGIEDLLKDEEAEVESGKQLFHVPKIIPTIKTKQIDFTNPVNKILYRAIMPETTSKEQSLCHDLHHMLTPPSPKTITQEKDLRAAKDSSDYDTNIKFFNHNWDMMDRFLDSPITHSTFQYNNCILDGLEYLQNTNEIDDDTLAHEPSNEHAQFEFSGMYQTFQEINNSPPLFRSQTNDLLSMYSLHDIFSD